MKHTIESFCISAQGASHVRINKVCQDYSIKFGYKKGHVIAVSDGHGGDKYFRSHIGSKSAASMAKSSVLYCLNDLNFAETFMKATDKDKEDMLCTIEEYIIGEWNDVIGSQLEDHPFTEEELAALDEETQEKMRDKDYRYKAYGATLIVGAVVSEGFWFGLQIGDGTFVVKQNGEYTQPIELDPKCVGVNVTSICDKNAIRYFHHAWGNGIPEAIFAASDGVDESFLSVEGLYKFYDNIIKNGKENWEGNVEELRNYLPELSVKGSQDDVSLAAIIRLDEEELGQDANELKQDENEPEQEVNEIEQEKQEQRQEHQEQPNVDVSAVTESEQPKDAAPIEFMNPIDSFEP
jgi:hypothetical protein